jgi:hypothetical protein
MINIAHFIFVRALEELKTKHYINKSLPLLPLKWLCLQTFFKKNNEKPTFNFKLGGF